MFDVSGLKGLNNMNVNVTLTLHKDRISWIIVNENGYRATGSDPLRNAGGDYMVLLSSVVNRLNDSYNVDDWNFIRG